MSESTNNFSIEGRLNERRGMLARAISLYKEFAAANPQSAEAWFDLGGAQLEAGQRDSAEKSLRLGIALEPDSQRGLWLLGRALNDAGRYEESLPLLQRASQHEKIPIMVVEERARSQVGTGAIQEAVIDCVRNAIMRHGYLWRTNLGELLSGPARALLEQLRVTSRVVRKLEDSILAECYGRSGSYFRENGEIFNRSNEVRLGFSSRFTPDQTKFLMHFLPSLKKVAPGLRLYAYGSKFLADVPGPEHLMPFVEWRGIAGMLTYDAANLVGKDKLDIFCDLDWGNGEARTDIAIANPAATRWLWSVPNGRLRVAISNRYWTDETLALKEPTWQPVPATAKLGMAVWKDHQGFDLLAGEFKGLLDYCLKITKELNIYPYCSKGDTAPPIGKIDRAKKQKTLVSSDEGPSHRQHILDRWLGDVRKLGFSFNTALQAAELRVAVITPYTHDQIDKLEVSHRSVAEQTFPARHFLIGQGLRCEAIDQWDAEHLVLPEDPQDLGLMAISAAAKVALAQGYNAIAFIMPGQRYRANHLRDLALASTRERSDLTMSRAALVGTHGRVFAEHINMGNIPVHHDNVLATFLITGRALDLMPIWAAVPHPARYFATGIFRSALRARGLRQYMIANASVEVVANEAFTFKNLAILCPKTLCPSISKNVPSSSPRVP